MMNDASIRPSSRNTLGHELGLARGAFEEAAAHDAHAHARAERAQADHEADADAGVGLDHGEQLEFFHLFFPFADVLKLRLVEVGQWLSCDIWM
jgi:hypothetical protein